MPLDVGEDSGGRPRKRWIVGHCPRPPSPPDQLMWNETLGVALVGFLGII